MKILLLLLILTGIGTVTYARALLANDVKSEEVKSEEVKSWQQRLTENFTKNKQVDEDNGETDTPTTPDEETNEDAENVAS